MSKSAPSEKPPSSPPFVLLISPITISALVRVAKSQKSAALARFIYSSRIRGKSRSKLLLS